MSTQTNNDAWKSGNSGHQAPGNATPQQAHDWRKGAEKRAAEQQKTYDSAWKKTTK